MKENATICMIYRAVPEVVPGGGCSGAVALYVPVAVISSSSKRFELEEVIIRAVNPGPAPAVTTFVVSAATRKSCQYVVVADPLEAAVGMNAPMKGMDAALAAFASIELNAGYSAIRSSASPVACFKVTLTQFPL